MTMAMKIKEREEIVDLKRVISAVSKMRVELSNEKMEKFLNINSEQLDEILTLLDKYSDKDEWELAEMILYK